MGTKGRKGGGGAVNFAGGNTWQGKKFGSSLQELSGGNLQGRFYIYSKGK